MTSAQLEHAHKRMQQKWFDLAMAEQRGVSVAVLERMYNAYILAVEEYNRCATEYQHDSDPVPSSSKENWLLNHNLWSEMDYRLKRQSVRNIRHRLFLLFLLCDILQIRRKPAYSPFPVLDTMTRYFLCVEERLCQIAHFVEPNYPTMPASVATVDRYPRQ